MATQLRQEPGGFVPRADRDTPVQPVGADETRHAAAPVTGLLLRGGAEVPRD
jgi:hypothetical protein